MSQMQDLTESITEEFHVLRSYIKKRSLYQQLLILSISSVIYLYIKKLLGRSGISWGKVYQNSLNFLQKSTKYIVYLALLYAFSKKIRQSSQETIKESIFPKPPQQLENNERSNRVDKATEGIESKLTNIAEQSIEFQTFKKEFDYDIFDSEVIEVQTDDGDIEHIVSFALNNGEGNKDATLNMNIKENSIQTARVSVEELDDEGFVEEMDMYLITGEEVEETFTP